MGRIQLHHLPQGFHLAQKDIALGLELCKHFPPEPEAGKDLAMLHISFPGWNASTACASSPQFLHQLLSVFGALHGLMKKKEIPQGF